MKNLELLWSMRTNWRSVPRLVYFMYRRQIKIAGAVLLLAVAVAIAWVAVGTG